MSTRDWAGLQLLIFSPLVCLSYPSYQLFPTNQGRVRHAPSHVRLPPSQVCDSSQQSVISIENCNYIKRGWQAAASSTQAQRVLENPPIPSSLR